jgi:hypothetical protein
MLDMDAVALADADAPAVLGSTISMRAVAISAGLTLERWRCENASAF